MSIRGNQLFLLLTSFVKPIATYVLLKGRGFGFVFFLSGDN